MVRFPSLPFRSPRCQIKVSQVDEWALEEAAGAGLPGGVALPAGVCRGAAPVAPPCPHGPRGAARR